MILIAKSINQNSTIDSDFLKLLNISKLDLQKKIKSSWKNKILITTKEEEKYQKILQEICSIIRPYKFTNILNKILNQKWYVFNSFTKRQKSYIKNI